MSEEEELNAKKRVVDVLAGVLAGHNDNVDKLVAEVYPLVTKGTRIIVTGAAGSGKTRFTVELAKKLEVPCYDLDEYIPAGFKADYEQRFYRGLYKLWNQMGKGGWVLEHVHACRPDVLSVFRPHHAIMLTPDPKIISDIARARESLSLNKTKYHPRAMETLKTSAEEFDAVRADTTTTRRNWTLKKDLFLDG